MARGKTVFYPDYWVIETPWNSYLVSPVMARVVQQAINRWPRRRWVSIVDLAGARLFLRTSTIVTLEQSSADTRAIWRDFRDERKQENPESNLGL